MTTAISLGTTCAPYEDQEAVKKALLNAIDPTGGSYLKPRVNLAPARGSFEIWVESDYEFDGDDGPSHQENSLRSNLLAMMASNAIRNR